MEQKRANTIALVIIAVIAIGTLVTGIVLLFVGLKPSPRTYTGSAKLTVISKTDRPMTAQQTKIQTEHLAHFATSEKSLLDSGRELEYLNLVTDPESILRTVEVKKLPDSQVVSIKAQCADIDQAKHAVEIIAKNAKAVYDEMAGGKTSEAKLVDSPSAFITPNRIGKKLRPAGAVFAFGLCFLLGAAVGSLLKKR